jgi:hypothetical protein
MSQDRPGAATGGVRPGEIWLVEQECDGALAPLDRDALASANVVLYDRALEALVGDILPLGTYAEPLADAAAGADAAPIAARALRFAAEGWRVVQIVAPRPAWGQRGPGAGEAAWRELPVRVLAKCAGGREAERQAWLGDLPQLAAAFPGGGPVTVIVGPLAAREPAPGRAFTANGLAG